MHWTQIFEAYEASVLSRAELLAAGATGRSLTRAVKHGDLVRARRDHYCLPSSATHLVRSVRIGGRMACISALASYGVFVYDSAALHLHVDQRMTRLRSPASRRRRLTKRNRNGAVLHWSPLIDPSNAEASRVALADALLQTLRCQEARFALASIDNALHLGLVTEADVADVFARAPRRVQWLRELVDGRAESGQESVMRLLLVQAGLGFEIQVQLDDVGRVDFIVEGRLVVELDSKQAHEGWSAQRRDRRRDLGSAKHGLPTIRPVYQHVMEEPELILAAIRGLLQRQS